MPSDLHYEFLTTVFRPHPQARVKRFDGEFHSYAAVLDERALERAETADAELALWAAQNHPAWSDKALASSASP